MNGVPVVWIALAVLYVISFFITVLMLPGIKKAMNLEKINVFTFLSMWFIMPMFLIYKLIK